MPLFHSVTAQVRQRGNLAYAPSQTHALGTMQSTSNQPQARNIYQSTEFISPQHTPVKQKHQEQEERHIQINPNDLQYQWGHNLNVNQHDRSQ